MKRKFLQLKKTYLTFLTLIVLGTGSALAQGNNYKLNGNSNLDDSTSFIGSTNEKDFVIKTNAKERVRVDKFGNTTFKNYVEFQDSVRIKGKLHIGENSLVLSGFNPGGNDEINSTTGIISLGREPIGFPPPPYAAIKVGIGTQTPLDILHVAFYPFLPNNTFIRTDALNSSWSTFPVLTNTDGLVIANSLGQLRTKILLTGNATDVLLGDGSWGTMSSGSSIGDYCSNAPIAPITDSYEIPLGTKNYHFSGQGTARTNVGIGFDCTINPFAKLHVYQTANNIMFSSTFGISIAGLFDNAIPSSAIAIGVWGNAQSSNVNSGNIGVYGSANGGFISRAGYFAGDLEYTAALIGSDKMFKTDIKDIKSATDIIRNLKAHTYKMDVVNFPQFNFEDRLQYGFIAQEVAEVLPNLVHDSYMPSRFDSLGNETSPAVNYKSLNYNAIIPIAVQAINEINQKLDKATLSDQTVKTNVQNLSGSLDKVKQMRGVTYEWTSTAQNDMNLDSIEHIGFIAQEITVIEPLLTFADDSSLMHVDYERVVPLLVESVKELDNKNHVLDSINQALEDRLLALETCINGANICGSGQRTANNNGDDEGKVVQLENLNAIILDQNLPNPFAEKTSITYTIPEEVMEAQLLFSDMNGRIIKQVDITERGEGKLTVYGENLQNGIYTYSLIADGKLIATKKMVKSK